MSLCRACQIAVTVGLFASILTPAGAAEKCPPNIGKFRVGIQTYTFRGHTFEQAVQKAAQLGVKYIEAYPGQRLSEATGDAVFTPDAPPEIRAKARQILDRSGVKLHNFGVVYLPNDEAACRRVFEFAKEMGVEILSAEPPTDAIPLVERLVKEYGIRVAIHNHPAPSQYADPRTVRQAIAGRDARIGAGPDIGHWMRSGFEPIASLRMLRGRIISLHLKDLKEMGVRESRDWPLGQGILDLPALFRELEAQKFDGTIMIEYEASQPDPTADVAASLEYLRRILKPAATAAK
ncbi:MAG: hypothetical protein KatS3mg024_2569 [Armatimonadota bacterium]|nr:MAG: hypothetical protein KatS3mg024_2569 [Armatimonadota bacterium]